MVELRGIHPEPSMRISIVLLLCSCFASSAFAEASPYGDLGSSGAGANASVTSANGTTDAPSMVNGKYVIGYEGRGNYLKNDQLEKGHSAAPTPAANTGVISLDSKPTANAATTAAAAPAMRSDSALHSDLPKATPVAAPTPSATATSSSSTANTSNNSQNNSQTNTPMVLINGRLQPMH